MKYRFRLFIFGCIAWLCGFASLILFCSPYVPGNEILWSSDFEVKPQRGTGGGQQSSVDFWNQSAHGVVWEQNSGFAGSACIKLTAYDGQASSIQRTLANPQEYRFLLLRAKMRTEGVVPGADSWNSARLFLYFTDKDGKPHWDYPHAAASLTGTSPWQGFEKVFPVPEFAATATVVVQISSKSGSVWCDDISLGSAYKNSSYFILRGIVLVAGIVLAISAIGLFGLLKNRGWIPLVITGMILVGVLCSQYFLEMIAGAFGFKVFWLKKFGHLFLFFLLGLVATSWAGAAKKAPERTNHSLKQLMCIFASLLAFAALTEFLQFATLDRGPSIFDFFINTTGIIGGIASACFVAWIKGKRVRGV